MPSPSAPRCSPIDRAWVLLDTTIDDGTGLGPAIVWALRNGAAELDLVADVPLTVAARRAGEFALPIRVWALDGRDLVGRRPPAPPSAPSAADPAHLAFVADIEAGGRHGRSSSTASSRARCAGSRCAGSSTSTTGRHAWCGSRSASVPHDREAFAIIHGDVPARTALAGVVAAVAAARSRDAPGHPLNRLAPERQLRWRLEQEPWLVGMESVRHAEPPVPRRGPQAPCAVHGRRSSPRRHPVP